MALYCLLSPGGSPGVTTTALGLALTWTDRVLLAECDPMGRRVLPGFMADRLNGPVGPGLLGLAMTAPAVGHGPLPLEEYTLPILDDGRVALLHGLRDARHARHLAGLWSPLAETLLAREGDVLADLGRMGGQDTPVELLRHADAVVMVLKPTLVHVDAAGARLNALKEVVSEQAQVGLCLIEDGGHNRGYGAGEVERALGVPVLTVLPWSSADASVLSDGAPSRRLFMASLLMQSLGRLGRRMRKTVGRPSVSSINEECLVEAPAVPAPAGRS
ncbi:hypothetical protein F8568_040325 [Actinomadura sp. LD22]|uniref:ParA family protein n=1 Tax=Actinomadura physcomitrii TaxID=2650748 RepID=A0A6I4MKY9_9ACTN|nr:hypothetical protein [Actinomadura physcomitrii]MWA06492.1 hypothetical protein [Actinomadura physcomitrii]